MSHMDELRHFLESVGAVSELLAIVYKNLRSQGLNEEESISLALGLLDHISGLKKEKEDESDGN